MMAEAAMALFGLFSASIFLAHAIEAYHCWIEGQALLRRVAIVPARRRDPLA